MTNPRRDSDPIVLFPLAPIHNYGWDEILDWDLEDTTAVIVFYITCIYTFIGIWNKTFMLRKDEKEKP